MKSLSASEMKVPHVVIVGGGFGGLYAAQALRNAPVTITLVDKRNFHLFQPLLYQVATGGLSPADIASPLRAILADQSNVTVVQDEVVDIDPKVKRIILAKGKLDYDSLLLAAGGSSHYFGQDEWADRAPGLKTLEDAIEIRRQILSAFEEAEVENDPLRQQALMTFVIVGGGPTGVELAGAIAELSTGTLQNEFRQIDPAHATVVLLEGQESILPSYPSKSSANAVNALERLGVEVISGALVENVGTDRLSYRDREGKVAFIHAHTVLWAAGMRATPLTDVVSRRTGAELDVSGRIKVDDQLNLFNDPHIFVIGDMAHVVGSNGEPLPGVAPVAMQQGQYVARIIRDRLAGKRTKAFAYRDRGKLAVIGRNSAVGVVGKFQFSGFLAWMAWSGIHLRYLIEFDNQLLVLMQWAWSYFTRRRGARLITDRMAQEGVNLEASKFLEPTESILPTPENSEYRKLAA